MAVLGLMLRFVEKLCQLFCGQIHRIGSKGNPVCRPPRAKKSLLSIVIRQGFPVKRLGPTTQFRRLLGKWDIFLVFDATCGLFQRQQTCCGGTDGWHAQSETMGVGVPRATRVARSERSDGRGRATGNPGFGWREPTKTRIASAFSPKACTWPQRGWLNGIRHANANQPTSVCNTGSL